MARFLIATTLTTLFFAVGSCDATVETYDPDSGQGTIGPGGYVQ